MKYCATKKVNHSQNSKIGVLISNLGTPQAPTKSALKVYLKEFLSDPRVVEIPRLLWWLILNVVILNIRPRRSARAYQTVWTEQGSPLLVNTQQQAVKVREQLQAKYGDDIVVEFAMRYGQPAFGDVVDSMMKKGVDKLVVLPLYPQYSASTTGSTFDALAADFCQRRRIPELRFITHYHDFPPYIKAIGDKITQHWLDNKQAQLLIFSYHGIPRRYLDNGDPYHCECYKTSRLVAEYLQLAPEQYMTTFQSRFGREEWLKPYTDETLKNLPGKGVKSVQILCPGFSSDCLETIEEICEENRDYFLEAGGQDYQYIDALNSDAQHIDALVSLIQQNLHGWQVDHNSEKRSAQAKHFGAKS